MKVLVLGGTGLVGHAVIEELHQRDEIKTIKVITRREQSPFDDKKFPKIEHFYASLESLSSVPEAFDCDALFCCLGTTIKKAKTKEAFRKVDFDYPLEAGKLLKKQSPQAHYLIITAMGSDSQSLFFYNKVKGEVEDYLQKLELKRLTILRPSLILGAREESRFLEELGQKVARLIDPLMTVLAPNAAGVDYKKIARCMVAEALENRADSRVISSSEIKNISL